MTLDWLAQLLGLPAGCTGTSRTRRRRARWSRSPSRARPAPGRRVVVCSEHAHSSVDKAAKLLELELRKAPSTTTSACVRIGSSSTTPARSSRRSERRPRPRSIPVPRSPTAARRRASGSTSTRPTRAPPRSVPSSRPLRRLGARRLDRRQPAQVARSADGLLDALDAASRRVPRHLQPRARVPARRRGGREPERVHAGARSSLPRAQAVGRAALLRTVGSAGADPRARSARRALRGVGARRARLGGRRPGPFSLVCFRLEGSDETTSACSSASTTPARCSSRTRGSATVRPAARDRELPHDRGRRPARLGRPQARGSGALR